MARSIGMDATDTFRAVIVRKRPRWEEDAYVFEDKTYYEGPYATIGTARQRVSFWRNYADNFVDGWIEKASAEWKRVD